MLKIDVHPDVYAELEDSRFWYEERARNLGKEFLGEVDRAVKAVQRAPMMCPGMTNNKASVASLFTDSLML